MDNEKTRFIVRAAMTEYMILMGGALLIYLALQLWPRASGLIALVGGLSLALICVLNFVLVLRTSAISTQKTRTPRRPR